MTTKQRAYLKSLAMTMDPIFQIGKNSMTPELTKAVEEALLQAKLTNRPNRNEMFKLLSQDIELGRFYQTCELKEICKKYGLKQIKELKEWYDIESGTHRIEGKPRSGYWIKAIKA